MKWGVRKKEEIWDRVSQKILQFAIARNEDSNEENSMLISFCFLPNSYMKD